MENTPCHLDGSGISEGFVLAKNKQKICASLVVCQSGALWTGTCEWSNHDFSQSILWFTKSRGHGCFYQTKCIHVIRIPNRLTWQELCIPCSWEINVPNACRRTNVGRCGATTNPNTSERNSFWDEPMRIYERSSDNFFLCLDNQTEIWTASQREYDRND